MRVDRYRNIVRLSEIRELFEKGHYEEAAEAARTISGEKINDIADLQLLSEVFKKTGDFEEAKKYLLNIHSRKPTYRILEDLMEICLQQKKPEEADRFLKEFCRISGGDPRNYIYEYRIGRQLKKKNEQLLPVLQTLKAEEYTEKYAYELAKLYYRMGKKNECISECSDLILWFGDGVYVERAKALQAYFRGEIPVEKLTTVVEEGVKKQAEEYRFQKKQQSRQMEAESSQVQEEYPQEEEGHSQAEGSYQQEADECSQAEEKYQSAEEIDRQEENFQTGDYPEDEVYAEVAATLEANEEPDYEPSDLGTGEDEKPELANQQEEAMKREEETVYQKPEKEEPMAERSKAEPPEGYEQISFFDREPESVEAPLSSPNPELLRRLAAAEASLEEQLHEFAQVESVRKQIIRLLEVVITERKPCQCLIITGENKSGKAALSSYLARTLYLLAELASPKIAKITGAKLNQLNLFEKKEKLTNCCLVVEHAGELTRESTARLLSFLQTARVLDAVILLDDSMAMNALLRSHTDMNRMFNNRIHLPRYSQNELLHFADAYVEEQDYSLSGNARDFFIQQIATITRSGREGRLYEMMELLKNAIQTADERNKKSILSMAANGKIPSAGRICLTMEDFSGVRQ